MQIMQDLIKQYNISTEEILYLIDVTPVDLSKYRLITTSEINPDLINLGYSIIQHDKDRITYIKHNNSKLMCVHLKGGIGNQIYQLLTLYKYSKLHGYKPIYDRKYVKDLHSGDIIFDLYPELHHYIPKDNLPDNHVKYYETENLYQDIPSLGDSQLIEGYFQGEFYFDKEEARQIFANFIKQSQGNKKYDIGIHIRRGNALVVQHIYHVPEVHYYTAAMQHMPEGNVVVVTEDLKWAKEALGDLLKDREVDWINGNLVDDFKTLANCKKGMIIANSTYSWWAALLNLNNPIVTYPKVWFHPNFKNIKDKQYHSDGWISVLDGPETYDAFIHKLYDYRNKKDWNEIIKEVSGIRVDKILHINNELLNKIMDEYYIALYYTGKMKECVDLIKYYKYSFINEHVINNTQHLFNYIKTNKKVIATTDVNRVPNENELVIIYGNFPLAYDSLLVNNPCYRHFKYFGQIQHDIIEYDDCWNFVDKIYIINLDSREDRYLETVSQLIQLRIPLNKVIRFSAIVNKDWGCSASHLEVIKQAKQNNYKNIIVFEDDFMLTSRIDKHIKDIKIFMKENYNYDVCLLACHNDLKRNSHDDLLDSIKCECTTCSGYFISLQGIDKVLPIWEESLAKYKEANQHWEYACDISWRKIQKDGKCFIFKDKIGYQRPQLVGNKSTFYMY